MLDIVKWLVLIVFIVTNISIAKETMMPFIPVVVIRLTINALQKRVSEKFVSEQMMHLSRLISFSVSDCREDAQDAGSADSQADQVANRLGRGGGNCEAEYLCKVKCKYNPQNKTCKRENCP
jgi:hypothetical protein